MTGPETPTTKIESSLIHVLEWSKTRGAIVRQHLIWNGFLAGSQTALPTSDKRGKHHHASSNSRFDLHSPKAFCCCLKTTTKNSTAACPTLWQFFNIFFITVLRQPAGLSTEMCLYTGVDWLKFNCICVVFVRGRWLAKLTQRRRTMDVVAPLGRKGHGITSKTLEIIWPQNSRCHRIVDRTMDAIGSQGSGGHRILSKSKQKRARSRLTA